jgi:hypothetical protein
MAILFSVAGLNMLTKKVATISGLLITAVFFTIFVVSERINERRRRESTQKGMDHFRLQPQESISNEAVAVRTGNTLCLVRDYTNLEHLRQALETTHTGRRDLVVMTVHIIRGPMAGYRDIDEQRLFTNYEQLLFSRVVALAEKAGKHVHLLVVPSSNIYQAIAQTAAQLQSALVIFGGSAVISAEEQARRLGQAWEGLTNRPKQEVCCRVIENSGRVADFYLGAHAPALSDEDVTLIHRLWLDASREPDVEELHHKDIVTLALSRLEHDLRSADRAHVIAQLRGTSSLETDGEMGNDVY